MRQEKVINFYLHNLQDFFLYREKPTETVAQRCPPKNLKHLQQISYLVFKTNPEVLLLNEVGGLESLEIWNEKFLENSYHPFWHQSLSNRGIDPGALVKKEILENYSILSSFVSTGFTRGVLRLQFFSNSSNLSHCLLEIWLVHLKSKLPAYHSESKDVFSTKQRQIEVELLCSMYQMHDEIIPLVVCGDFNGIASGQHREPEFSSIHRRTKLVDPLENGDQSLRWTTPYLMGNKMFYNPIDVVFFNPSALSRLIGPPMRLNFINPQTDQPFAIPKTMNDKKNLPSDHYPLSFKLKLS